MRPPIHVEPAYAKLNLCLRIVGRRPDGFHLLDSLVAFVDLADTVGVVEGRRDPSPADGPVKHADDVTLSITGPFGHALGAAADNLVMTAARRVGLKPGARLRLDKRIPVAAGLGGGSSDAAATLRLINRRYRLRLSEAALHEHAGALGADVPVCLMPRPARMRGIGEVLDPWGPLPDCGVLLANPKATLPTADVFRAYARRSDAFSAELQMIPRATESLAPLVAMLEANGNDLAPAAMSLLPAIDGVLQTLRALPGAVYAGMSGSGATCFALFATRGEAEHARQSLGPQLWTHAGSFIPREMP